MRQSRSVVINRSVKEVFDFAEDPANAPAWAEGIVGFEMIEETEDKVGTTYRMIIEEGGRENDYRGEVLAWEQNERTVNRVHRQGMAMVMERAYEDLGGQTRLTMTVDYELEGLAKVMTPLAWLMNRHFLKKQTIALKELLEER